MHITHYLIPTNGVSRTVQANPCKPIKADWFAYIRKECKEIRLRNTWFNLGRNKPAYLADDLELFIHWRRWEMLNK